MAALEKVVNTDSGTFNTAGVREVGRYFHFIGSPLYGVDGVGVKGEGGSRSR
ncbi:MAG TPA: hypothetical protein VGK54_05340 [Chloroflexota bacterium]